MPTVLLVDDDLANRMTLAALLEDSGFRVVEAGGLIEARGRLGEALDAAIVDLNLGDGLGTELLVELRRRLPNAVLALLSGEAPPSGSAADLVLLKGEPPGDALRRLNEQLDARRAGAR